MFSGTECDNGFCPDDPIDRATMAVWTVRVLDGADPEPVGSTRFGDVDASHPHAAFIERFADLGVTQGCGDGTNYCPEDPVIRAQMAVFLSRAYNLAEGPDPGFSDVSADAWYASDVARLAASGVTRGCGDGTRFCPGRATTRAQMATFLHRGQVGAASFQDGPAFSVVSAGYSHSCGLLIDGTIECGANDDDDEGRADAPAGAFSAVSAGGFHTCGLRTNSTIECWGNNDDGQANAPAGAFSAVSAGGFHTCGLRTNSTIECWGNNDDGQANAPAGAFSAVSAGGFHTCGLRTNSTIECWGNNDDGSEERADRRARRSFQRRVGGRVPYMRAAHQQHHRMLGQQRRRAGQRAHRSLQCRVRRSMAHVRAAHQRHHHVLGIRRRRAG